MPRLAKNHSDLVVDGSRSHGFAVHCGAAHRFTKAAPRLPTSRVPAVLNPTDSAPDDLLQVYAGRVRVRVGGLLVRDGAILLAAHRGLLPADAPFWSPPGGGWQFGESIRAALVREFREETGLAVRVGRFLHLHEFSSGPLQALELFFEVFAADAAQPQLGHDPEHDPGQQLLTELAWLTPRQLMHLPPTQAHPILHLVLSPDDVFVPQVRFA